MILLIIEFKFSSFLIYSGTEFFKTLRSFEKNYKKLLVVTGKGSRSKSYDNPYISENLSVLKNSVPEYIKNDKNLNSIIKKIIQSDREDGGEGAINIFLKNNKKFIK